MSSTLLISVFVFLPIAVIIAVVLLKSKKNENKKKNEMMKVYRNIVADNQLAITDVQILYDRILAVDAEKKVFLYVHNHADPVYDLIHLHGLSGCKVEKKGTNLTTKSNGKLISELYVNEVYLSLLSHNTVLTNLRVYSEILDGQQEYLTLTQIADDWQHKLNAIIRS